MLQRDPTKLDMPKNITTSLRSESSLQKADCDELFDDRQAKSMWNCEIHFSMKSRSVISLTFRAMAVKVTNVVVFLLRRWLDGRKANLAKTVTVGTPPIEWTMAMGVKMSPKHREEHKV
eukprot:scaffold60700_cov73-Cyclotella_meneghiniana.AAC.1